MREPTRTHLAPRAGPVAGLPIDELLDRAADMARRWAIALVVARPLDGLGELPLEDLAREAPQLCAQVVRALASEAELGYLRGAADARADGTPARRLSAMSGSEGAPATVEAAEALRGAVWETVLEELSWPTFERWHARLVADVSDRLAYVCASALAAALDAGADEWLTPTPPPAAAGPAGRGVPESHEHPPMGPRGAVIVDEREDLGTAPGPRLSEIEIRDERGETGPAAWIGSISGQLARFAWDDRPFAVLLVDIRGLDRLRREDRPEQADPLAQEIEHELDAELRSARGDRDGRGSPSGSVTREREGRYWLLAPDTDRTGARLLTRWLTEAVHRAAGRRRVAVEVAVGTAVFPADGREAAALAAHADVELYAARSATRAPAGTPPSSFD